MLPRPGFRLANLEPAARLPVQGAADLQRSCFAIEVFPLETANLAPAQAGGELGIEEVVPEWVGLDSLHKTVQFLVGEDTFGRGVRFRQSYPIGGVPGDNMGTDRIRYGPVEHSVNASDSIGGKMVTILWMLMHPALFSQLRVQPLNICCCNRSYVSVK